MIRNSTGGSESTVLLQFAQSNVCTHMLAKRTKINNHVVRAQTKTSFRFTFDRLSDALCAHYSISTKIIDRNQRRPRWLCLWLPILAFHITFFSVRFEFVEKMTRKRRDEILQSIESLHSDYYPSIDVSSNFASGLSTERQINIVKNSKKKRQKTNYRYLM